jgi:hypothetical protein
MAPAHSERQLAPVAVEEELEVQEWEPPAAGAAPFDLERETAASIRAA